MDAKKRTALLGLAFLVLLVFSYVGNTVFFSILGDMFARQLPAYQFLAVVMLFVNNVLVVSLILLGMSFYVSLVISDFFKREKYAYVVVDHPRIFALVFTIMIVILSILRANNLIHGSIIIEALPWALLVSAPVGIVEGYGIYLTIKKTLSRTMSMKDLAYIYGIFFIAALIEVGFINLLIWVTAG